MTATVTPLRKPKRRRRSRCEFCNELYHKPEDFYVVGVCPTCWPAVCEIWRCEYENLLAGDWTEYRPVIAALARDQAELVLVDQTATLFHALWRRVPEENRPRLSAEIRQLAAESRRASMHLVHPGA